jgi:hypothetical protein
MAWVQKQVGQVGLRRKLGPKAPVSGDLDGHKRSIPKLKAIAELNRKKVAMFDRDRRNGRS